MLLEQQVPPGLKAPKDRPASLAQRALRENKVRRALPEPRDQLELRASRELQVPPDLKDRLASPAQLDRPVRRVARESQEPRVQPDPKGLLAQQVPRAQQVLEDRKEVLE